MRKLLFLFWVTICISTSFLNAQHTLVALDKMNILYKDVPNPLTVLVNGYKAEDIRLEMGQAEITRLDQRRFICRPGRTGNVTLHIYIRNKLQETYTYRVRSLPAPVAALANIEDEGVLDRGAFITQPGLTSKIEGFDYDLRLPIYRYRIRLFRDGRKLQDQSFEEGPTFSVVCKQFINTVQVGDVVVFSDMQYKDADNQLQNSRNPYITIEIK